jgi:sugar phosphate isomerase/epimerase
MPNKTGVCDWSLPVTGPFALQLAAKAGFDGIQLGDLGGIDAGFPMNDRFIQQGYLQAAADSGVTLHSLHPYGLQRQGTMLWPMNTPKGEQGRKSLLRCIDACADMGIDNLMVSSFFQTMINNDWDLGVYAQHLKCACEAGRDKGVLITYEGVLTVPKLMQLFDMAGGDNLKMCYDILNPRSLGTGDPQEQIRALGTKYIDHFHVKDATEDYKNCCLIGEGRADYAATTAVIRETGFEGWYISENTYPSLSAVTGRDCTDLAAEDVATIRKYWN